MGYSDLEIRGNSKFLKIDSGEPHDIRLLDDGPMVRNMHGFGKEASACTGDGCLRCKSGSEPKQRFSANVFDHGMQKVLIWEFGASVAKQLKAIDEALQEENKNITEVDLKVDATGNNMQKKYIVTPRMTSKPVPTGLVLHTLDEELAF